MYELTLKYKIKEHIRQIVISLFNTINLPYFPYSSYWHMRIAKRSHLKDPENHFFTAIPNRGAGIGHQLANWIAGYWFAQNFGLKFAHIPFSSEKWENFFCFGTGELTLTELINKGYKIKRLPRFDENNEKEVSLIKAIIASYQGNRIVFIAEQDQFYKDQYGIMDVLKQKYYSAPARKSERILFDKKHFNIAVHIRRGDIMSDPTNPNLTMRFLANDYYEKVLEQIISRTETSKPIHIWLFSQGEPDDYKEFKRFKNIHWCLDMNPQDSFSHMVYADLLITSKSSFSYKPALISNGIKVCPKDFWHSYPKTEDWILVDNYGILLS